MSQPEPQLQVADPATGGCIPQQQSTEHSAFRVEPPGGVPALLVLEDGRSFRGASFGAEGETFGEPMFSTGMTGYQETLTDPSCHRQLLVATAPHIGNTGWVTGDDESGRIWAAGCVVRERARLASNWRADHSLDAELRSQGIVGISGVDTRAITRHLRERGGMRAGISTTDLDPDTVLERVRAIPAISGRHLADEVSGSESSIVPAIGERRFRVVALDIGVKTMSLHRLAQRGIETHVLPENAGYGAVIDLEPDGLFLSGGPGDPSAAVSQIETVRQVLNAGISYFGIGLGHQIFGRALGLETYQLPAGHHGPSQPVQALETSKVEMTAHNHGFAVAAPSGDDIDTVYGTARVSHVGPNDQVVEGLELRDGHQYLAAFSVQFHPEAAAGPHDADYLFDRFADLMARRAR